MAYTCQHCIFETGVTSILKSSKDGKLVCDINPAHKFQADAKGFIHPVQ